MALLLLVVFLGTLMLVMATYGFVNRHRLAVSEVVRTRLSGDTLAAGDVKILREQRASSLDLLNRLLAGKPFTARIAQRLERAGSRRSVGEMVLLTGVAALGGYLLFHRLGPVIAILFAGLGAAAPWLWLIRMQSARVKKFEAQLPEAIDMLVNAMKSGYSLQAAMKFIGEEMTEPLGPEFARFYEEQRLGIEVRTALLNLQERVPTLDLKMFVTALLIQRETGGNLAEIMTNLSTLMRDRAAIRGHIDTLTAEPKMSAVVLTLLPIGLFFAFSMLNRSYMSALWLTPEGRFLLGMGALSTIFGSLLLRQMARIDI